MSQRSGHGVLRGDAMLTHLPQTQAAAQLLIIDDDPVFAAASEAVLSQRGHQVEVLHDSRLGQDRAAERRFDMVLLDLEMPGRCGFEVCRYLRGVGVECPILVITGSACRRNRIGGLRLGADDVIAKPVDFEELCARIDVHIRRHRRSHLPLDGASARSRNGAIPTAIDEASVLEFRGIRLDGARHEVSVGGTACELAPREFDLLEILLMNPTRLQTRDELLNQVWGRSSDVFSHSVTSHVQRLRAKLDDCLPGSGKLIKTVWGKGYTLERA